MIVNIITVVVRLSKLAEITNVTHDSIQSIFLLLRVRSNWEIKSKHPLLYKISTIVMVANRNKTISEASPTYFRNMFWAMNCFTVALVGTMPFRKATYSVGCSLITKSEP